MYLNQLYPKVSILKDANVTTSVSTETNIPEKVNPSDNDFRLLTTDQLCDMLIAASRELKKRAQLPTSFTVKEHTLEELNERFGEAGTKQVPTETGYLEVMVPVSPSLMQQHNETYHLISAATADGCPEDPVKWTGEQIEKHPEVFDLLNTPTPVA